MVGGDIRDQTRQVIENMRRVLAAHGADLGHVVKTTVWLTDKAHLAGFNETYREMFDTPYPARSTVVSGLVADADIEIEAVAYVPSPD
jgi:enamine deaminase RidA (YjgF/YER057c/UK114 family)